MATQAGWKTIFGWREGKLNGAEETLRGDGREARWTAGNPKCVSGLKQNLNARREGRREAGVKPGPFFRRWGTR